LLSQADPNATNRSLTSVTSVNLERINLKNAQRLAKLENANLDDSNFGLSFSNTAKKQQAIPRLSSGTRRVSLGGGAV